jgi:hypothetical protein
MAGRLESIPSADQTPCVSEPHLFRVILPVTDTETASSFYARVLGIPGSRVTGVRHTSTASDPFDNPICVSVTCPSDPALAAGD